MTTANTAKRLICHAPFWFCRTTPGTGHPVVVPVVAFTTTYGGRKPVLSKIKKKEYGQGYFRKKDSRGNVSCDDMKDDRQNPKGPHEEREWAPTRSSLLERLRVWNDHGTWLRFFETYWKLIYGVARQAGLSDAEAQDAVQETVITVSRKIEDFRYDREKGTFKGWLLNIARWRIADQFRKRQSPEMTARVPPDQEDRRTATIDQLPDQSTDPLQRIWNEEWRKNLMDAAISRVKRQVDPKQFQIFDCYVLQGWTPRQVARELKVTQGRVYLAKHRIGALIKREIRRLESEPL
jgi:RNA polymerase sigma-70 factor (ECF subfamily)